MPTVVVELYTSQGCSSCPPADRWLGGLRRRHGDRVLPLSMHVAYWDYIGWRDPFARSEFTARQRDLARANASRSVYTPGVFVQGLELRDWSVAGRFEARLEEIGRQAATARLTLTVDRIGSSEVAVRVAGQGPAGARLWVMLLGSGLTTRVDAGENRGETLRNDGVVRDWQGPLPLGTGTAVLLKRPAEAVSSRADSWAVAVLADDAQGRTLQAVHLPLAECVQR
ncbi:MAG: DUF1223 domain-containing protein [Piscinibacter sp.]